MGKSGSNPVRLLSPIWRAWTQDQLFRKVLRNTGYLFSSNSISAGLSSLQGILAALLLGPDGYGTLGIVVGIVTNVNRLLSFRMTEVVIKYAGQFLANDEREKAVAVVKMAAVVEAITSICAYLILYFGAPLAGKYFLKSPGEYSLLVSVGWIRFYGLIILANILTETSTAVLNIGGYFRIQAGINLAQSVIVMVLIVFAYWIKADIFVVLISYLLGKFVIGFGTLLAAFTKMKSIFGSAWLRYRGRLANTAELIKFAISTNLSGTINLIIRDSEVLWVGFFLSTEVAGYYKFALAVMNVILMPITPFISTTYPEINQAVAQKNWNMLKNLLKRTTIVAGVWTGVCGLGIVFAAPWLLSWLKGGVYLPSYPLILVLFAGFGVANLFFWNRNLLLALNQPQYPLRVTFFVGLVKTVLMFLIVRPWGVLAQAGLLSAYLAVSIIIIVVQGVKKLREHAFVTVQGVSSL